ncbi:hypothetical protein B5C34_08585 [Pacificimonas flava]|uniref:Translocation and assembly module TamB C-terminal domain-containing protein n=2 Tax=Pacificimonas TaxID=1960290 RepID=A0A219B547_9SPHN|nr:MULTISPECIES: translocation/assembly module TamB domain-containing protein [Pacificimonas]MBZ6379280.1 translocation/assembly module TamB domain-containing protein [Pacificimonas aurantium]OWV33510.1 hypothetical protein B5C34_08585 [Pacificimonas flava]
MRLRRHLIRIGALTLAVPLLLLAALLALSDTQPGRDLLLTQLGLLSDQLGVEVRAQRITGSLRDEFVIEQFQLADRRGTFFEAPTVTIRWQPQRLISNQEIVIDRAYVPSARLARLPVVESPPSGGRKVDVDLASLHIDSLALGRPVVGQALTGALATSLRLRGQEVSARARLQSAAGGDRVAFELDAVPSEDRFGISGQAHLPAGGLVSQAISLDRTFRLQLAGAGNWSAWQGRLRAEAGDSRTEEIAALQIVGTKGSFRFGGRTNPGALTGGLIERVAPSGLAVRGSLAVQREALPLIVRASGDAIKLSARGRVSPSFSTVSEGRVRLSLLQPANLLSTLDGENMQLTAELTGALADPDGRYEFSADWFSLGNQRILSPAASGRFGPELGEDSFTINGRFDRLTGAGDFVEDLLRSAAFSGGVRLEGLNLEAPDLRFRNPVGRATGQVRLDLRTGRYDVQTDVNVPSYEIPGYGAVAYRGRLHLRPDPALPRKLRVSGPSRIETTRLDNGFLRFLAGGLPRARAQMDRDADGIISFGDARVTAPSLSLEGDAAYLLGGQIEASAAGRQEMFGDIAVDLSGAISRPAARVDVVRYDLGLPIRDIAARFEPDEQGYAFELRGSSMVGPVQSRGRIDLGQGIVFRIEQASVAGLSAHGHLSSPTGVPVAGTLDVSGPGISGDIEFSPAGSDQRIAATALLRRARLGPTAELAVGRGTVTGEFLLSPGSAPQVDLGFEGKGLQAGDVAASELQLSYRSDDGRGRLGLSARGQRGRPFDISADAVLAETTTTVDLSGTFGDDELSLTSPARFEYAEAGWRLPPVRLRIGAGQATLAASAERGRLRGEAIFDGVPLAPLSLADPRLSFSGTATGRIEGSLGEGDQRADISLRLNDLLRLTEAAADPVDIGILARLRGPKAAVRTRILGNGGARLGALQARLSGLSSLAAAPASTIANAPVDAYFRYDGPAEAVWPLTGVSAARISGPVSAAVDIGGTVDTPNFDGYVAGERLRFESAASGTLIEDLELAGRFEGPTLTLTRFEGESQSGGTVSGAGQVDLSFARGFPFDIRVASDGADLVDIATLRARVSGDILVEGRPEGGRISGDLAVDSARYRTDAAQTRTIPLLEVEETGTEFTRTARTVATPTGWELDVRTTGSGNIMARGQGLDSEWAVAIDLTGDVQEPKLRGRATLVRGDYDFAGRRFELTRGEIDFQGAYPPDPALDIDAESRIEGFAAQIRIRGTANQPEIELSSIPALPQDEILSRILFGSSIAELNAAEAIQLAGAVASLQAGETSVLDPIGNIRSAIGIDRLRLGGSSDGGTSIAAGEFIGRRTYLEFAADTRGGTSTQIEYALNRAFSLLGRVSTFGGNSIGVRISDDY